MMRGKFIGKRLPTTANLPFSPFSTTSGGGGRGRGRGGPASFNFVSDSPDSQPSPPPPPSPPQESGKVSGYGRGRGTPLPDSFSSFLSAIGRGQTSSDSTHSPASEPMPPPPPPQRSRPPIGEPQDRAPEAELPSSILSVLGGAGRGVPTPPRQEAVPVQEENRHLRPKPSGLVFTQPGPEEAHVQPSLPELEDVPVVEENRQIRPKLSQPVEGREQPGPPVDVQEKPVMKQRVDPEEAKRRAMEILSRASDGRDGFDSGGRGRGMMRGRGRGGRGRGRGRGQVGRFEDEDDEDEGGLELGDNADGEKLASKVGPEIMNELTESFEDIGNRVLPSPADDMYLDALHTNCMIEFEPEYLVEFENPDIDEKPPMSLREVLEKSKPFLMAYEGIQSQEEWEQAVDELMERVPLLKEIVDHYSGPDRVTAKQQHEELERVAKTIPKKAPTSVKNFADRAVLSLQSNPGWGWDKKCQFMDKFVEEVSQHYK